MPDQPSQSDPFVQAVADTIDNERLIAPSSRLVVGVSGGVDSVVLLDVLATLAKQPDRRYHLTVGHLNHALRDEANADADFVAQLAKRYALSADIERRDVAGAARQTGQSIETAGRTARYEFLHSLAAALDASYVAVAHHADDNIETVLHRLLRGTHLRGLAGIPIRRPLAGSAIELVRPMLLCHRSGILAYAERAGLQWREDPTNIDTRYRRNFIRHELLPMLRDRLNPRVDEALIRLAGSADEAEDHLSQLGLAAFQHARLADPPTGGVAMDALALREHPAIEQTYAVRCAIELLDAPLGAVTGEHLAALTDLIAAEPGDAVSLPGRLAARRQGDQLLIAPVAEPTEQADWQAPIALVAAGTTDLPNGAAIDAQIGPIDRSEFAEHCRCRQAGVEYLDADAVVGPLICRPRQEGDVFHPLGAPGRQSVSDFLTNAKVPADQRGDVVCVCDDAGIVCVLPLRIDQRVKVSDATQRVIRLHCHR
ncbi:MAG: tRNA lysidine(34) synthetase TilS [Planctomycetota bacterium]|jgi:tRNA(Ile)-lysidine synthase